MRPSTALLRAHQPLMSGAYPIPQACRQAAILPHHRFVTRSRHGDPTTARPTPAPLALAMSPPPASRPQDRFPRMVRHRSIRAALQPNFAPPPTACAHHPTTHRPAPPSGAPTPPAPPSIPLPACLRPPTPRTMSGSLGRPSPATRSASAGCTPPPGALDATVATS
jgi:hypothetical protein